jgi:3-oxoacyl-[acyl-carrier protein] reductase
MTGASQDALSLKGRVAVVTGGGRGIGAATSKRMAEAGAFVAVVDQDAGGVTRTAKEIGVAGGEAIHFQADVTDSFAIERLCDQVVQEWGSLDILVNNAGIVRDARIEDVTEQDWDDTLDVNARGTLVCTRAVVHHMRARKFGRILSATSIVARRGNFGQTAYAASKAAIIGMTRVWARELGRDGITANAVAPGFIDTEMGRSAPEKVMKQILARTPAGRMGHAEEVANVYVFLASDLASFINGAVVGVDGGLLL